MSDSPRARSFPGASLLANVVAIIAGVLVTLSFAPFEQWWLGPIGAGLLYGALRMEGGGFLRAWWFGVGLFGSGASWVYVSIHDYGYTGMPLAVLLTMLFVAYIGENALISTGTPILVFSMEMPADALAMRMLSSLGRIDQTKVRGGKLEEDDWPRLTSAVSLLKDKPLYIDDTPGLSPTEMRSRARRVARENGGKIGLIMVDYLQLMRVPGNTEGRTAEISEISRSLKGIAKELGCPVVALSQLNRSLEQRPNKRPVNSDLRESGAIEQDADVIMFVYRDEVYNEDTPDKGIAEIIIGKQRNGPIGTIRLAFIGKYTKFEDLAHGDYSDYGGDY